tara:strand:- start:499 stop:768 length:270 start_codon:yes stop_codon:yes gene_type:complete
MNHYIAINAYRTSTSNGFANTWVIYLCHNRQHQKRLLTIGLPVIDEHLVDNGINYPCYSTSGIRVANRKERQMATQCHHYPLEFAPDTA